MRIVPYEYQPNGAYGQCQRCGFKYRLADLRQEWSGLRVCGECYDPLPDTMRPPVVYSEGQPRPNASPELPDTFVGNVQPSDL